MGSIFSAPAEKLHVHPPRILTPHVYPFLSVIGGSHARWHGIDHLQGVVVPCEDDLRGQGGRGWRDTTGLDPTIFDPAGNVEFRLREVSRDKTRSFNVLGGVGGTAGGEVSGGFVLDGAVEVLQGGLVVDQDRLRAFVRRPVSAVSNSLHVFLGYESQSLYAPELGDVLLGVQYIQDRGSFSPDGECGDGDARATSPSASAPGGAERRRRGGGAAVAVTPDGNRHAVPYQVSRQSGARHSGTTRSGARELRVHTQGPIEPVYVGEAKYNRFGWSGPRSLFVHRGHDPRASSLSLYVRDAALSKERPGMGRFCREGGNTRFGMMGTALFDPVYLESVAEVDVHLRKLAKLELAVSWMGDHEVEGHDELEVGSDEGVERTRHARWFHGKDVEPFDPGYEGAFFYSFSLKNEPRAGFSVFRHYVVPRRVFAALDSRYKLIDNYIDLGVQLSQSMVSRADPKPEFAFIAVLDIRNRVS